MQLPPHHHMTDIALSSNFTEAFSLKISASSLSCSKPTVPKEMGSKLLNKRGQMNP